MKTTTRDRWSAGFYWLGVVMTFAAVGLVLLGNTKWIAPLEHTSFPLAWKLAIVAVVAFLAREFCRPVAPAVRKSVSKRDGHRSLDHIPYEI